MTVVEIVNNTALLKSMLDFLPDCWNVNPQKEIVFTVTAATGIVKIEIQDMQLAVWHGSEIKPVCKIDLVGKTIAAVAAEICATPGLEVVGGSADKSSAGRLIYGTTTDGRVYAFTSTTWAIFQAFALELGELLASVKEALRHLSIPGATGIVQNYWGDYFACDRSPSELDNVYGQRILAQIKIPRSNNVAMEMFVKTVLGYSVVITDLGMADGTVLIMNNTGYTVNSSNIIFKMGIAPAEPCTFAIALQDGVFLLKDEEDKLRELICEIKESGTRPKLFWKGLGNTMIMNRTDTPMHDTGWILMIPRENYRGWYAKYL